MLKIFLPFKNEFNPYLEEVIGNSGNRFIYGDYRDYNPDFDIVNIHWPEAIFNWEEPTQKALDKLERNLIEWKKNSLLVYTKHDFQRNKGTTPNFNCLFNLVESYSDVFIHLGLYSKEKYRMLYPEAKHEIIHHPLFEKKLMNTSKFRAREKLGIDQNARVIMIPGTIRSFKERDMVLRSFKSLKLKNKVLVSTNMRAELRFDFRGRIRLKNLFDVQKFVVNRFKQKHQPPGYFFNYSPMSDEDLSIRMSAADVIMVPRKDNLNSGIVFLGLTYQKVVVGPGVGNIQEQLKELNFPIFDPDSVPSIVRALEKGFQLSDKAQFPKDKLAKYQPENVAMEYESVFLKYK